MRIKVDNTLDQLPKNKDGNASTKFPSCFTRTFPFSDHYILDHIEIHIIYTSF